MDQLRQKYTNWLINQNLNYALKFNGINQYASLGTMGNFGSNLGNGFYNSFQIQTTNTTLGEFGQYNGANSVMIGLNAIGFESLGAGHLAFFLNDSANNNALIGYTTNNTNFNDGNKHIIVITANPATNIITISVDSAPQAITYIAQQTPSSFGNFGKNFCLGGRQTYTGAYDEFFACTIDNFQIGTSSSVLYGNYKMDEGSGTTIADSSGNGNTGTLVNDTSPSTMWVPGL